MVGSREQDVSRALPPIIGWSHVFKLSVFQNSLPWLRDDGSGDGDGDGDGDGKGTKVFRGLDQRHKALLCIDCQGEGEGFRGLSPLSKNS